MSSGAISAPIRQFLFNKKKSEGDPLPNNRFFKKHPPAAPRLACIPRGNGLGIVKYSSLLLLLTVITRQTFSPSQRAKLGSDHRSKIESGHQKHT
jgi:hypothetical protein